MVVMSRLVLSNFRKNRNITRFRRYSKVAVKEHSKLGDWEPVIGLEIHAQIAAKSKLFSGAATNYQSSTNAQVAFLDAALPGTLPVLNRRCVEAGVLTALALNCNLNMMSRFDRKHYFYADLPAGYQITQQRQPLGKGGFMSYAIYRPHDGIKEPIEMMVRFIQLQLEQDSGKSLHDEDDHVSLIDLNRAGIGLMEIVTEPDFRSSVEATSFVSEFQLLLQRMNTCDGKMEEGSLRVDASVSLHRPGEPLGTRAEVKNLNSIISVGRAIDHEIDRQKKILDSGGEVQNETRNFDATKGVTIAMRDKEKVHDYRFMPEPNLPPLHLYDNNTVPTSLSDDQVINVDVLKQNMPETPFAIKTRLHKDHGITHERTIVLLENPDIMAAFEELTSDGILETRFIGNILPSEVFFHLRKIKKTLAESGISIEHLRTALSLWQEKQITQSTFLKVLKELTDKCGNAGTVEEILEKNNLYRMNDLSVIEGVCQEVLDSYPDAVEKYKKSTKKNLKFFKRKGSDRFPGGVDAVTMSKIFEEKLSKLCE